MQSSDGQVCSSESSTHSFQHHKDSLFVPVIQKPAFERVKDHTHVVPYEPPKEFTYNVPQKQAFEPVREATHGVPQKPATHDPSTHDPSPLSGVMVLQNNNTLMPIEKHPDVHKFLNDVIDVKGRRSSHFKKALKNLCSVPIDVLNHYCMMGEFTRVLQQKNVLTDVKVRLKKKVFSAHRVMLACFSEYFREILFGQSGMISLPVKITLKEINPESFKTYLDFIYSGVLDLNGDNVADMLFLAEKLGVNYLSLKCIEYDGVMSVCQALTILRHHQFTRIELVNKIIHQNFKCLDQYTEFFGLDVDTVCAILAHRDIAISKESDVFQLGLRWVLHNHEHNKHFIQVMKQVRFNNMNPDEVFRCAVMAERYCDDVDFRSMIVTAHW